MSEFRKALMVGVALGVAVFVSAALVVFIAARAPATDLKEGPMEPSVAEPAAQLGKAFAMVAAHVRPAVVSVYSEKTVNVTRPEFQFPFGGEGISEFADTTGKLIPVKARVEMKAVDVKSGKTLAVGRAWPHERSAHFR